MIKWDHVIPQATFLTSSFFPRLSRKVRRGFLISAPLDVKDSSRSAPVLALLAYRQRGEVTEGRVSKWSRKMHVHATALQWTHHRGTNRQESTFLHINVFFFWRKTRTILVNKQELLGQIMFSMLWCHKGKKEICPVILETCSSLLHS